MNRLRPQAQFRDIRRGFTLIELLTVIAIIGILAAIIIPTVGKVRDSARASQCASNIRQVAMALRLYAEDNKGVLPAAYDAAGQDGDVNKKDWTSVIDRYLPKPTNTTGRHPVLTCPSNNYDETGTGTNPVAHTYSIGPGAGGLNNAASPNDTSNTARRTIATVRSPSMAVWLMEGRSSSATYKTAVNTISKSELGKLQNDPANTANNVQLWHGGKNRTNIAFGDGSVRLMGASDFTDRYPDVTSNLGWRKAAGLL